LEVQVWSVYWAEIERRIGAVFARSETRACAMAYLADLLSLAERKNSWPLAEISGAHNSYGFQHLLGRADWNPDDLRDRLRAYVTDDLHAPDAVGVIDETGFLKKGTHAAGVARQYSGTAGRMENSQMGVFLAYASCHGHTYWTATSICRPRGLPIGSAAKALGFRMCAPLRPNPPWHDRCWSARS
jgi:SRSO17 transposase